MILTFQNVSLVDATGYDTGLREATFALEAGALLLLRVDTGQHQTPLPDLAQGLLEPETGTITFRGDNWQELKPDAAAARRGQIGRVFESGGWLSNLDVDENITLGQRYHTERAEAEIVDEARGLARDFGLDDLPMGRPHTLARDTLRRAQWVRAFLGQPALLIFEHAADELEAGLTDRLMARLSAARAAGAAAVWITTAAEVLHPTLNPTLNFTLKATKMLPS